jgi:DNA ligase D-like protein (predicted 3'-phosphoesterase)
MSFRHMTKKYLEKYRSMRDFRRTGEPRGGRIRRKGKKIFVIQKHDASHLHYDLRLEIDGVLKSWAVPKGVSTDPGEKRLAVMTEDHPLEYADFEGVIPAGEYGGGTVLIWDEGTYRNLKGAEGGDKRKTMAEALDEGHMTFWLEGKKIRGGYGLIHTKSGGRDNWLLVKMDDEEADARRNPVSTEPESVRSGRTLEEIATEDGKS